jgi:HSP20 family molecular chaperone IbpA
MLSSKEVKQMKEKRKIKTFRISDDSDIDFDVDFEFCGSQPPIPPEPPGVGGFAYKFGKHHRVHDHTNQFVDDDKLTVILSFPGIVKSTIKVRAKTDTLIVSADISEEFIKYFGKEKREKRIRLIENVNSDSARAKYIDGMLKVEFEIVDQGRDIKISEE